jgi:hypothetical protein
MGWKFVPWLVLFFFPLIDIEFFAVISGGILMRDVFLTGMS